MKRNIILFFTLFWITSPFTVHSQNYNATNVHYYLAVGYSIEDIDVVQDPYASASILSIRCIIIRGNSIYSAEAGPYTASIKRNRQKYIDAIEGSLRRAPLKHSYDNSLSTSKFRVYTRNIPASMWGPATAVHYAIQRNFKQLIYWEDGYEDKKQLYYEIDIEDVLPKNANLDFLE